MFGTRTVGGKHIVTKIISLGRHFVGLFFTLKT